jgi:hypothetical protein
MMRTPISRMMLLIGLLSAVSFALLGAVARGARPLLAAAPPAACSGRALSATFTYDPGSNATGHELYTLTVRNRSTVACTLSAPPALTLRNRSGRALPTHAIFSAPRAYRVTLAPSQWAQAIAELSADMPDPGENARGNCEPVAHSLSVRSRGASLRAAMDPTPVCEHGFMRFGRLAAVQVTAPCSGTNLGLSFQRQEPAYAGFTDYALKLRNNSSRACHLASVVGLRLLSSSGQPLPTRVSAGVASPFTIPRGVTETADARLATRGGSCDAVATQLLVTPNRTGAGLSSPVSPPVTVCRRGLIVLSSLLRTG